MSERENLPGSIVAALDAAFSKRPFITGPELAGALGIDPKTLLRLGDSGKIGWRPKGASSDRPHRQYAREDADAYLRGDPPCPYSCHGKSKRKRGTVNAQSVRAPRNGSMPGYGFSAQRARERKRQIQVAEAVADAPAT